MEIELREEHQKITTPNYLKIIREVTEEDYSNNTIATIEKTKRE